MWKITRNTVLFMIVLHVPVVVFSTAFEGNFVLFMAVFVICSSLPLFCQSVVTLHLLSFDFPTVNVSSHLKLNCWPYQC